MMERANENRDFLAHICFSDESTFTLNNEPNSQNTRIWANENPRFRIPTRTQYPQKINVWCGIFGGHIIGPFFIQGNLNGQRYLDLLNTQIIPALAVLQPDLRHQVWFQHDGCPAHSTEEVRRLLTDTFAGWIGRGGTIGWPARSPDLTPMDFFFGDM